MLCGGKINGEQNLVLSEVMKEELLQRYTQEPYNLREKDMLNEGKSVDTSENAEFAKHDIFEMNNLEKDITLVTRGYHINRSRHIFEQFGYNVEPKVAENVLIENLDNHTEKHYKNLMKKFRTSKDYLKKRSLNFALNMALYIPMETHESNYEHIRNNKKEKENLGFPKLMNQNWSINFVKEHIYKELEEKGGRQFN